MRSSRGLHSACCLTFLLLSSLKHHAFAFAPVSFVAPARSQRKRGGLRSIHFITKSTENDTFHGVTKTSDHKSSGIFTTTRRGFLLNVAVGLLASTALVSTSDVQDSFAASVNTTPSNDTGVVTRKQIKQDFFEPIDIQKVALENKVNITLVSKSENSKVYIDRTSFDRVKERTYPAWVPNFLRLKPKHIGRISDAQLIAASALAGSITEFIRFGVLYPITTVKTRVQTNHTSSSFKSHLSLEPTNTTQELVRIEHELPVSFFQELIKNSLANIRAQVQKGELYAGFLPAAMISVPASGVYFAVSDVMKKEIRQLNEAPSMAFHTDDLTILLLSALVADVVSLAFKTPAVTFSTRKQAQKVITNSQEGDDGIILTDDKSVLFFADVVKDNEAIQVQSDDLILVTEEKEDWSRELWNDCWSKLPTIIVTDLPYLLLKISLLKLFASGHENIAQFEALNIFVACIAAALTTPFDVARTVILVDSDNDASNGVDGGSREGILEAMRRIVFDYEYSPEGIPENEDDIMPLRAYKQPNFQNLYAGCLERVAYLGIGVASLQPLRTLSYYALRDALLLGVFRN